VPRYGIGKTTFDIDTALRAACDQARTEFLRIDRNREGTLQGDDLQGLADFTFRLFHLDGGCKLTGRNREEAGKILKQYADKKFDGKLNFAEFERWFVQTCSSLLRCPKVWL
jgi:hypothetical protein